VRDFDGIESRLVFEAYVGSYLAEYARKLYRGLHVNEYALAAKHVLVQEVW